MSTTSAARVVSHIHPWLVRKGKPNIAARTPATLTCLEPAIKAIWLRKLQRFCSKIALGDAFLRSLSEIGAIIAVAAAGMGAAGSQV